MTPKEKTDLLEIAEATLSLNLQKAGLLNHRTLAATALIAATIIDGHLRHCEGQQQQSNECLLEMLKELRVCALAHAINTNSEIAMLDRQTIVNAAMADFDPSILPEKMKES